MIDSNFKQCFWFAIVPNLYRLIVIVPCSYSYVVALKRGPTVSRILVGLWARVAFVMV